MLGVSYSIPQEDDNGNNTTRKLTLYNSMEEPVKFSVTQTMYGSSYATGSYVASLIYEGVSGTGDSGIWFQVNGQRAGLGVLIEERY